MRVLGPARKLMEIETEWAMLPPPPTAAHPEWEQRWQHLFQTYAPAMVRYVRALLARSALSAVDREADDIVQAYLSTCLAKGWLSRDAEHIRSFRAYLKTQLYRFTCDHIDRRRAQKRNPPGVAPASALDGVASAPDEVVASLDAGIVDVTIDRVLQHLEAQNPDQAEIIRDLLRTDGEGSSDLAARLGRPATQLPVMRHRARRAFAALFVSELRATVSDPAAFTDLLAGLAPHLP